MHKDARKLEDSSILEGDICIVGAGAAGISLALELNKSYKKVILLESGGFEYDESSQQLNNGTNIGQKYFPLKSSRLRLFGGTTGIWSGFCAPLDSIDFEDRYWIPHSGWPITKKELTPFYERAQRVLELGPYNYDPEYWESLLGVPKLDLNTSEVYTKMWQKSPPTRMGEKYRNEIINSENVELYTFANLTNIDLTENAKEVRQLEVKTISGKRFNVRANCYVMACGAIQNTRQLLHANSVMKRGVGNQNDLVGRYFMEHPHVDSAEICLAEGINMDLYYESILSGSSFGMLALSEQNQREKQLLNYSAQLISATFDSQRNWNVDMFPENPKNVLAYAESLDEIRSDRDPRKPETTYYILSTRIEQAPNSNSRITLSDTKDVFGIPEYNLDWRLSALDKKTILEANKVIGNELGKNGLGRLHLQDWLFEKEDIWSENLTGGWHHMGTTRMHNNPKKGVVDENLKVHGSTNLYIAGSSVFPTSGTANPTLTIVALSIRLADYLMSLPT